MSPSAFGAGEVNERRTSSTWGHGRVEEQHGAWRGLSGHGLRSDDLEVIHADDMRTRQTVEMIHGSTTRRAADADYVAPPVGGAGPQRFELAMRRFAVLGCPNCDGGHFPDGERQGPNHFAKRFGEGGDCFRFRVNGYLRREAFEAFTGDDGLLFVPVVSAAGVTENCTNCDLPLASVIRGRVTKELLVPDTDWSGSDYSME
jgi:hypothetical protein